MGYIRRSLMPGEHITYSTRLHWIVLFWPLLWFAAAGVLTGYGLLEGGVEVIRDLVEEIQKTGATRELRDRVVDLSMRQKVAGACTAVGSLLTLVSGLSLLGALLRRASSEFAVTNRRVVFKVGFLRTLSVEVLLSRVESMTVAQGILGWLLGYGSIEVKGIGGTVDPFHRVADPMELRRAVHQQASADQR